MCAYISHPFVYIVHTHKHVGLDININGLWPHPHTYRPSYPISAVMCHTLNSKRGSGTLTYVCVCMCVCVCVCVCVHLTSQEISGGGGGDIETVSVKVMKHRLEWLGHVVRIPDQLSPN